MDKDLEKFFAEAKNIGLDPSSKAAFLAELHEAVDSDLVREGGESCLNGHMTPQTDRLLADAKSIRLSPEERKASFARVEQFMDANPIGSVHLEGATGQSPWEALLALVTSLRLMPVLAVALLFLIGSGITTVAAEGALPGDTLYPVKIHISEPVRLALAGSVEAKAELETELAQRRMDEARAVVVEGEVDADKQAEIAARIEDRVQRARNRIVQLSASDNLETAADLSTQLEAALKAHHNAFAQIAASNSGSVNVLLSVLAKADALSAQAQADLQTKLSGSSDEVAKAVAQRGIAAAQMQADALQEFLNNRSEGLNQAAHDAIRARYQAALDAIVRAQTRLDGGDAAQALNIAAEANANAREGGVLESVQSLIRVNVSTDDDSSSNVDIKVDGDAKPAINVQGGGNTRVRVNGKDIINTTSAAASSAFSLGTSKAAQTSKATQTKVNVEVNNSTTSAGSTTNSNTQTHVESHIHVEGGGSVQINQKAGANVNVKISN